MDPDKVKCQVIFFSSGFLHVDFLDEFSFNWILFLDGKELVKGGDNVFFHAYTERQF